jgi:hypothetical protein
MKCLITFELATKNFQILHGSCLYLHWNFQYCHANHMYCTSNFANIAAQMGVFHSSFALGQFNQIHVVD